MPGFVGMIEMILGQGVGRMFSKGCCFDGARRSLIERNLRGARRALGIRESAPGRSPSRPTACPRRFDTSSLPFDETEACFSMRSFARFSPIISSSVIESGSFYLFPRRRGSSAISYNWDFNKIAQRNLLKSYSVSGALRAVSLFSCSVLIAHVDSGARSI